MRFEHARPAPEGGRRGRRWRRWWAPARARWRARAAMSLHELTDEQREIRDLARRFADEEIAPHAARLGPRAHLPARGLRAAGRARADGRLRARRARRRGRRLPVLRARARGALARRRGRGRDRRRPHQRGHAAAARARHARAGRAPGPAAGPGPRARGLRADRVRAGLRRRARCARAPTPTAAAHGHQAVDHQRLARPHVHRLRARRGPGHAVGLRRAPRGARASASRARRRSSA